MKKITNITRIIIFLAWLTNVNAAEISMAGIDDPGCENIRVSSMCITVLLEGKIEKGDKEKLEIFLDRIPSVLQEKLKLKARVGKINLNSSGGDLFEGMAIGRLIRKKMITTQVTHDSICYSSCVIAYAGGVKRIPIGPIGIHSFYSREFFGSDEFSKASERYNKVSDRVEKYLKEIRIPISLLDEMKKIPHNKLEIMDLNKLEQHSLIGIDAVYAQVKEKSRE